MATEDPGFFRFGDVNRVAPTRAGAVYLALVAGVLFGAVNTGNNLVYLVLGVLLAALVVANVLAEWNLRSLTVTRRLPAELRAGVPATGALVLRNRRGRGGAWHVTLTELGSVSGQAFVEFCAAGGDAPAPAEFLAPERGLAHLTTVRIESDFPFGMVRRWRDVPLEDAVLVYPAPAFRALRSTPSGEGDEPAARGGASASGDFAGLRPWSPGDPLRRVHWPTSARAGTPMVVTRAGQGSEEVVLRLEPSLSGAAREAAISRIASQAETALAEGNAVGLDADGDTFAPRSGGEWRRRILTALARLERR